MCKYIFALAMDFHTCYVHNLPRQVHWSQTTATMTAYKKQTSTAIIAMLKEVQTSILLSSLSTSCVCCRLSLLRVFVFLLALRLLKLLLLLLPPFELLSLFFLDNNHYIVGNVFAMLNAHIVKCQQRKPTNILLKCLTLSIFNLKRMDSWNVYAKWLGAIH